MICMVFCPGVSFLVFERHSIGAQRRLKIQRRVGSLDVSRFFGGDDAG